MTCPGKGGPRPASGTGRDDKAHKDGLGGGEVVPSAGRQAKEARVRARLATCCVAEAKLSYLASRSSSGGMATVLMRTTVVRVAGYNNTCVIKSSEGCLVHVRPF